MKAVAARLSELRIEVGAALLAFAVLCLVSGGMLVHQSQAPHFVHQAAGWLQGRLSIPGEPPNLNDWVRIGQAWHVSFPPFPAFLMLPFVALNGVAFNDVFFTVCVGGVVVGLFVWLLRGWRDAGEHQRSDREILLLAGFYAFGTVFFYSAIRGEVWFTAHVVGAALTLLYLAASRRGRHPALAGLAFGCALLTRANLAFAFPFFLLECVAPEGRLPPVREWLSRAWKARGALLLFGACATLVVAPALWANHARFGSWTEFGHRLLYENRVNDRVREHGLFSLYFLADNFRSAFLLLPKVTLNPLRLGFDGNGMSIFLTTPLVALVPFAVRRARPSLALGVTAAAVALPALLYMNNGWYQFGFRFANDFLPYLFVLLALGGRPFDRVFVGLGVLGVAVSTWGAFVFGR